MDWDEIVLTSLSLNSHNNHTFVYIFPLFRLSSVYFILFYSAMISSDLWVFYASTTVHCTWNKTLMKTHLVWTLISVNYWLVSNGLTRRQYIIKFKAISYKFEIWNTDAFLFHYYDIFCHGPINHQELYARGFG